MLLKDRVAIITGGARGMGRAIALRFAKEGCSSVIVDLLDKDGEKTVADIDTIVRDAIYIRCDVTSSAQVKDMVAKAIAKFKKIDIMANCAGIGKPPKLIGDISEEEYDKVVAVNMKGIFLCLQAEENALLVDGNDLIIFFFGDITNELGRLADAGAVSHDINLFKFSDGFSHHVLHLGAAGNVAADIDSVPAGFLNIGDRLFAVFIQQVDDDRGAALFSEAEGDSPAHAAGTAGNNGNPV